MQNQENLQRKEHQVEMNKQSFSSNSKKGNLVLWLLMGIVVIILLVGGLYYYMNQNRSTPDTTGSTTYQQVTDEADLETEVNSIDVSEKSSDFDTLDKDLQSL